MLDTDLLTRQVLSNCDISDAAHAGLFSICGLALRLRDLYKWEHRLAPWIEKDTAEILDWIGAKEQLWEAVAENKFCDLSVNGSAFKPFEVDRINRALEPHGLFYGAGYAHSLKPTFLLAKITEILELNGFKVVVLGRELARDLLTLPALTQLDTILMRTEAARLYLWDQISYIKKSGRPALSYALNRCGVSGGDPEQVRQQLDHLLEIQKESFIFHEIGELSDTVFKRRTWQEIIAAHPRSPVELVARVLKDLLADTDPSGTLARIIQRHNEPALAFYAAFLDGLNREFFPEMRVAFQLFTQDRDWGLIEQAVGAGRKRVAEYTGMLMDFYRSGREGKKGPKWVVAQVEKHILEKVHAKSADA